MAATDTRGDTAAIDTGECLRLLATEQLGRVVLTGADGLVDIVPVAYVVDGESVVFAAIGGPGLAAVDGDSVAFEADQVDDVGGSGWTAVVHGAVHVVAGTGADGLRSRLHALAINLWADDEHAEMMRLVPSTLSCRRLPGPAERQVVPPDTIDLRARWRDDDVSENWLG